MSATRLKAGEDVEKLRLVFRTLYRLYRFSLVLLHKYNYANLSHNSFMKIQLESFIYCSEKNQIYSKLVLAKLVFIIVSQSNVNTWWTNTETVKSVSLRIPRFGLKINENCFDRLEA